MSFRVSDRVTPVIDTGYAMGIHTGRLIRRSADAPAAAWYWFVFFRNMWLSEPHVRDKGMVSSTRPEAKPAFGAGTRPEQTPPRNAC